MPENDENRMEKAGELLKELFGLIGIKRVICVDDEYGDEPTIEEITGRCASLIGQRGQDIFDDVDLLRAVHFGEDDVIWRGELAEIWDGLSPEDREVLAREVGRKDEAGRVDDPRDASILKELIRRASLQGDDFLELRPRDWRGQQRALLQEARGRTTLFLFDIDLTHDGGTDTEGLTLLRNALASAQSAAHEDDVLCGLLTHRFRKSEEYERWDETARDNGIDRDRFVLISKDNLRTDPVGFARMVRLTVLNAQCGHLKNAAARVLHSAQRKALKRVAEINVYDFDRIVFDLSGQEGLWELDTIFRLHGLFLRDEARKAAEGSGPLRRLAAHVRHISHIDAEQSRSAASTTWRIQRLELYESNVNTYHLPIELGDIFENIDTGERYVLLAQPCDLAVRSGGKRGSGLTEVTLAEIVEKNKRPPSSDMLRSFELKYFAPDAAPATSARSCWVDFRKRHTVALDVLDLSVYRADGSARLALGDRCPKGVIPVWAERYSRLEEGAKRVLHDYRALQRGRGTTEYAHLAIPKSSHTDVFKGKIGTERSKPTLSYGCKRIDRLCQPHAGAMLTQFANYLARAAFDVDLGQA